MLLKWGFQEGVIDRRVFVKFTPGPMPQRLAVLLGVHVDGNLAFVFTFSLLAIAPFAERLSYVTEQLALHTSQTLGGLLNATFGNVTELIVSLFALRAGLLRIVQVSLLGSILSNLLLVLGTAFLVGGIKYPSQVLARLSTLGTDLALSMTCDL